MAHPAVDVLTEICGLQELKKDTIVTKSVLATATNLLSIRGEGRLKYLTLLMTKLRESYATMLESVQRYKLTATKTDKLWVLFHNFSLQEGHRIQRCTASGCNHDTTTSSRFRVSMVAPLECEFLRMRSNT